MGKLGPILGRDEVTAQLVEILLRRSHHPVLLGEKGAGHLGRMLVLGELTEGSHARVEVREGRLEVRLAEEPRAHPRTQPGCHSALTL